MAASAAWRDFCLDQPQTRLKLADAVLNFFLFTPLVVLFWHGAEGTLDLLVLDTFPLLGSWLLLCLSVSVLVAAGLFQRVLPARLPPPTGEFDSVVLHIFTSRFYNYVLAFFSVCHFRALEGLYEYYAGESVYSALRAASTGLVALWGVKCGRNILAPPLYLETDIGQDFYFNPTLFRTEPDLSLQSLLDNVATILVVHTFSHLHWVGAWMSLEQLLPANSLIAMTICLVLGYSVTSAFLLSQRPASQLSRKLEEENNFLRIAFEDVFLFVANFGCIAVWCGLFKLYDNLSYYFPIYYKGSEVTPIATNILSFVLMCVAMVSNTLSARGVEIDGELEDGDGVLFATEYFYEYLHDDLEEAVKLKAEISKSESLKRYAIQRVKPQQAKATATVAPTVVEKRVVTSPGMTSSGVTSQGMTSSGLTSSLVQTKSGALVENSPGSSASARRRGIPRNTLINPDAAIGRHNVGTGKTVTFGPNVTNGQPEPTSSQQRPAVVKTSIATSLPQVIKKIDSQ